MEPGWIVWVLRNRPEAHVVHIVRHPGGFLNSLMKRLWSQLDMETVVRDNRERLARIAAVDPIWASRFGDLDTLSPVEAELWYWRYSSETIHQAGEVNPRYQLVKYEELTNDPVEVSRSVYRGCGLDWDDTIERAIRQMSGESQAIARAWEQKLNSEQIAAVQGILPDSLMRDWWDETGRIPSRSHGRRPSMRAGRRDLEPGGNLMKAALIGTGQIAQQHLACLRSPAGGHLGRGLRPVARLWRNRPPSDTAPPGSPTIGRCSDEVRPDVVHITTPPPSHFRLAMDALAAGAHVIVEKPITTAHDQVAVLLRSAAERERALIEDYNYLYNQPMQRILELARSGELGEVVDVEVTICVNILAEGSPFVDRNVPHPCLSLPGGAIADFLSHLASLAHGFVGRSPGGAHATGRSGPPNPPCPTTNSGLSSSRSAERPS